MKFRDLLLVAIALTPCSAGAAVTDAVARILEVKGEVKVITPDNKHRAADVYGAVFDKERLLLSKDSAIVLGWLADGRMDRLSAPGEVTNDKPHKVTIGRSDVTPRKGVEPIAVKKGRNKVVVAGLNKLPPITQAGATIPRGSVADPVRARVTPIDGSTTRLAGLAFTWPKVEQAARYELTLVRGEDPLWNATTKEPCKRYDGDKLDAGEYLWTVSAINAQGAETTIAESAFHIEDPPADAESDPIAALQELATSDDVAILSLAAFDFETHGRIAEAIQQYERLVKLSPKVAPFHAALTELYEQAGRRDDAKKHRQIAAELGFKFAAKPEDK